MRDLKVRVNFKTHNCVEIEACRQVSADDNFANRINKSYNADFVIDGIHKITSDDLSYEYVGDTGTRSTYLRT